MSERQYALWDEVCVLEEIGSILFFALFLSKDNLGMHLTMEELDSSNGILFPFYDEDTSLIFLCGKVTPAIQHSQKHRSLSNTRVTQPFVILNTHQKRLTFITSIPTHLRILSVVSV